MTRNEENGSTLSHLRHIESSHVCLQRVTFHVLLCHGFWVYILTKADERNDVLWCRGRREEGVSLHTCLN